MKRVLASVLLAGIALVGLSTGANAAGNADAKIMLHALPLTTKNQCNRTGVNTNLQLDCAGYDNGINNKALYPTYHYAYLLVVDGDLTPVNGGIAGMQCGIAFDPAANSGVDVFGWSLCATLEFSSTGWPQSGGGNLITFNTSLPQCTLPPGNANIGAVAVFGYFYMGAYTPDLMRVTPRPVDGLAKVANCASFEDIVFVGANDGETFLGAIGFGRPGINPCGRERPVGVENSTWSGVKNLVGSN